MGSEVSAGEEGAVGGYCSLERFYIVENMNCND